MKREKYLGIFFGLVVLLCGLPLNCFVQLNHSPVIAQTNNTPSQTKTAIARIWHGRTLSSKAILKKRGILLETESIFSN